MTDDDDLRARLRDADPAAGLPPLPPARIDRLMEETMAATTTNRRPVLLAAAAALALVVAGAGIAGWVLNRPAETSTTTITAAGVRAKCVEPTAATLAERADFAFAGTVTAVTGDVVTLHVTRVYRGEPVTEVEVAQTGGASETLLGSGAFETGRDYLVSSAAGAMLICGYSGESTTPGLPEMFDAAF
ncbi:hypothetical protein [Catenuloplanes japonicus]|uniref:hypothetical protein n=1 Tax=Catenuloplanes japonicus TaxID=33876 RepID=UPI0005251324|nr:hypothetical protein [Catenuloplanes japonicus]